MFAAALLMPEDAVREDWQRVATAEGMARRFNVSESAMNIRLKSLGLI
jgi:Zn-dependent peptidase ImmA (M78 family)